MSDLFVRLHIGDEHYALPVDDVLEVTMLSRPTPVPGGPAGLIGLQNCRGKALPVYDLASILGARGGSAPTCLVVAVRGSRSAGLVVDGVIEVGALPEQEPSDAALLSGTTLVGDTLVGVVDVDGVFSELERRVTR